MAQTYGQNGNLAQLDDSTCRIHETKQRDQPLIKYFKTHSTAYGRNQIIIINVEVV